MRASPVAFERPDELGNIPQVLGALCFGQAQRGFFKRVASDRMPGDPLRVLAADQSAVPDALRIEGHVRSEIALAEARVPDQVCVWLAPQQLDQPLAKWHPAALATVRSTAHHDVHA
jgi:hypothetical protein